MKQVFMAVAVVFGLLGAVYADAPKIDVEAKHQAELRKAWQQGFEQGYQRANALRDNQQMQHRKQMMEQRRKMIEKFAKVRAQKAATAEAQCPKAACADRPRGPKADRPRGPKADRPRGPKAEAK